MRRSMRPCTGLRAEAYRSVAALPDRVRRAKPHLTVRVLGDGTINSVEVVLKYGYPEIVESVQPVIIAVSRLSPLP